MKKIILIFLLFVTLFSRATNYYISPSGNDTTGNGSIGLPWRMLSKACSVVTTFGDLINVEAGTYQDNKECLVSSGIKIVGAGYATTRINTSFVYLTPNSLSHGYITLLSQSANMGTGNEISGINFDGQGTATRCITFQYRNRSKVHDCYFSGFTQSAILFNGITSGETAIEPLNNWQTGNSAYNNTIVNVGIYQAWAIGVFGQDSCAIFNNDISNILTPGTGGNCLYSSTTKRFKVHDNTFTRGNYVTPYWNFCTEIRWVFGEFEYNNNRCKGAPDVCYVFKNSHAFGAYIHDNIVGFDVPSATNNMGFTMEGDQHNVRITRNIVKNINTGITFTTSVNKVCSVDSIAICFNQLQDIGTPATYFTGKGISFEGSTAYSPISQYRNIMIYNNSIIGNNYAYSAISFESKGYFYDFKIKNNIVAYFHVNSVYGPVKINGAAGYTMAVDSLVIDKNLFYSCGNSNDLKIVNCTPTNTAQTNTVKLNPKLINRTYDALNYRLQPSSPAINAGINLGFTSDFMGTTIPTGGGYDIGAYEWFEEFPAVFCTMTIEDPSFIGSRTATINATLASAGGGTMTASGLCWNTTGNPTTSDNHTTLAGSLGPFLTTLTLNKNTTYYVRAYGINERGAAYSSQITFKTSNFSVITYNGKIVRYKGKTLIY